MHNAKKKGSSRFVLGMIIYALVFLIIAGAGLAFFWDYIAAYEASRPKVAIEAYMQNLTEEHICDLSQGLIDQVDHNIQTQEQCRAYIMDAIDGIAYAKKSKECTATRQVFVLRTGGKVIGEFSIVARDDGKYGFTPWYFEQESFDLSALNLFGSGYETVVPSDHTVTVNGFALTDAYITDEMIPYEQIEDYYEDYALPYRVSYAVAPIMGELDVVITDSDNKEVTFDEHTDWTAYFHNCSEEEAKELDEFTARYLDLYITFTGSRRNSRYINYERLIKYIVKESDFATRLWDAVEGLEFGQSQSNKIVSVTSNHQVRLAEGKYLHDFSYEVDITGYNGVVRDYTNAKIIIVRTDDGLKVESMNIY